jgi:Centromere DNA-binding protein complex CBF3 subunit, domain 2
MSFTQFDMKSNLLIFAIYLEPPAELLAEVFPWVEREQAALLVQTQNNPLANDMALRQFLQLLIWLRRVLIQDAAVLFSHDSSPHIFQHSIFHTAAFHNFAAASQLALITAEEEAQLAFKNLPDRFARSLRGTLTNFKMEWQQDREEHREQQTALDNRFGNIEKLLETLVGSKSHGLKSGEFTSN